MTSIYLRLDHGPRVGVHGLDLDTCEHVKYHETIFSKILTDADELLFYDWLENQSGQICGIEIHERDNAFYSNLLDYRKGVATPPYPQILFRESLSYKQRGLECFGDIVKLISRTGERLIVVRLDTWISAIEIDSLINDFGPNGGLNPESRPRIIN